MPSARVSALKCHTDKVKTKNSNSTKKGKPSDRQDLARAVTESPKDPPGQLQIPAHQGNSSELYLRASAAVCSGRGTELVHIQK